MEGCFFLFLPPPLPHQRAESATWLGMQGRIKNLVSISTYVASEIKPPKAKRQCYLFENGCELDPGYRLKSTPALVFWNLRATNIHSIQVSRSQKCSSSREPFRPGGGGVHMCARVDPYRYPLSMSVFNQLYFMCCAKALDL